jgi:hypothetical protein
MRWRTSCWSATLDEALAHAGVPSSHTRTGELDVAEDFVSAPRIVGDGPRTQSMGWRLEFKSFGVTIVQRNSHSLSYSWSVLLDAIEKMPRILDDS